MRLYGCEKHGRIDLNPLTPRSHTHRVRCCRVLFRRVSLAVAVIVLQIVAMDGGHLKGGRWNGVMLTLSCKGANNTVIHVATIIGPKENAELYQTLLQTCKKNEQLKGFLEDSKTTYFTDGHKGSPAALKREAKDAQHRVCLKHITNNLTEKIGSVSTECSLRYRSVGFCNVSQR